LSLPTAHTCNAELVNIVTEVYPAGPGDDADRATVAYYRHERVIKDIAAFCEEQLAGESHAEDRARSLRFLASNFAPGGAIEMAHAADR
jgi:hypothetical protein